MLDDVTHPATTNERVHTAGPKNKADTRADWRQSTLAATHTQRGTIPFPQSLTSTYVTRHDLWSCVLNSQMSREYPSGPRWGANSRLLQPEADCGSQGLSCASCLTGVFHWALDDGKILLSDLHRGGQGVHRHFRSAQRASQRCGAFRPAPPPPVRALPLFAARLRLLHLLHTRRAHPVSAGLQPRVAVAHEADGALVVHREGCLRRVQGPHRLQGLKSVRARQGLAAFVVQVEPRQTALGVQPGVDGACRRRQARRLRPALAVEHMHEAPQRHRSVGVHRVVVLVHVLRDAAPRRDAHPGRLVATAPQAQHHVQGRLLGDPSPCLRRQRVAIAVDCRTDLSSIRRPEDAPAARVDLEGRARHEALLPRKRGASHALAPQHEHAARAEPKIGGAGPHPPSADRAPVGEGELGIGGESREHFDLEAPVGLFPRDLVLHAVALAQGHGHELSHHPLLQAHAVQPRLLGAGHVRLLPRRARQALPQRLPRQGVDAPDANLHRAVRQGAEG
mmetsp:Transcript_73367/g.123556  ORF Transcript_73367/g.123556 Transcript_73367/m.123556 type:complete len:507 (-) Transcript_73367:883-2403(-)